MDFYRAEKAHLDRICEMIAQAQAYFKDQGIEQWQNGYPNREVIAADMEAGHTYVLEEEKKIVGTLALILDGEPDYDSIYEGQWRTMGKPYAALHRVIVDASCKGKGAAGVMIREVEKICGEKNIFSIRNDTHEDNYSMRRMLEKNGFQYCGVIYLKDGAKRVGFEKIIVK